MSAHNIHTVCQHKSNLVNYYLFGVIARVRVVFRKTIVGDWHFEYLRGSHLQSQVFHSIPFHSNLLSELKTNLSLRVCVWCCSHGFWFHGRIQGYSCTRTWLLHGSLLVSDLKETSCALFLQATQRRSDWPLRTSSTLTRQPIASHGSSYQLDMPSRFIETSTTAYTTGFKQRETSSYRLQSELEGSFIPKDYNRECKSCGQFSHLVFSFFSFTSLPLVL